MYSKIENKEQYNAYCNRLEEITEMGALNDNSPLNAESKEILGRIQEWDKEHDTLSDLLSNLNLTEGIWKANGLSIIAGNTIIASGTNAYGDILLSERLSNMKVMAAAKEMLLTLMEVRAIYIASGTKRFSGLANQINEVINKATK